MDISALEISDSNLRALRLGRRGNNLVIGRVAQTVLEGGIIVNGMVTSPEKLTLALRNFLKANHFSEDHWIISLPTGPVFTVYKIFPNLAQDALNEAVEINLPSILPGKKEEISWGSQEIEPQGQIVGKEVMVSSISQKDLAGYLSAFSKTGIVPIAIEPKSLSIARVLGKLTNTLVLSLEGLNLSSVVSSGGFPRFARNFQIAAEEKEQFKSLLSEIRRVINYYLTEQKQPKIEKVILDGPSASPELANRLNKAINLEVVLAGDLYFSAFGTEKTWYQRNALRFWRREVYKVSGQILPSLSVFGAALRALLDPGQDPNLSLLPVSAKEAAEEKRTLLFYGGIANLMVITTILFLLLFFGTWGFFKYLDRQTSSQLESVANQQTSENSQVTEIIKTIKEINPLLTLEGSLEDQMTYWSGILETIESLKPAGVTVTNLENAKDGQSLTLTGTAQSREGLGSFRDVLSAQDFAESVQMPTSNFAENQNINFTIVLTLKKDALKKGQ